VTSRWAECDRSPPLQLISETTMRWVSGKWRGERQLAKRGSTGGSIGRGKKIRSLEGVGGEAPAFFRSLRSDNSRGGDERARTRRELLFSEDEEGAGGQARPRRGRLSQGDGEARDGHPGIGRRLLPGTYSPPTREKPGVSRPSFLPQELIRLNPEEDSNFKILECMRTLAILSTVLGCICVFATLLLRAADC
jgi:hypothetical protein